MIPEQNPLPFSVKSHPVVNFSLPVWAIMKFITYPDEGLAVSITFVNNNLFG